MKQLEHKSLPVSQKTVESDENLIVETENTATLGSSEQVPESIKLEAEEHIIISDGNIGNSVVIIGPQVLLQGKQVNFQKVEIDFVDMLNNQELLELYTDQVAEGEILKEVLKNFEQSNGAITNLSEKRKQQIRDQVSSEIDADPNRKENVYKGMQSLGNNKLKELYNKKFNTPIEEETSEEEEPEDKEKRKQEYQQSYAAWNEQRAAMYTQQKGDVSQVFAGGQGMKGNIGAKAAEPTEMSKSQDHSSILPPMLANMKNAFLKEMELGLLIPQKPEYLSKKQDTSIYYSRYTFLQFQVAPQLFWAELNMMIGVIAIVGAAFTAGTSLLALSATAAELYLGVAELGVNYKLSRDLQDGKLGTEPEFLGLNQDAINLLGLPFLGVEFLRLGRAGLKRLDATVNKASMDALEDAIMKNMKKAKLPEQPEVHVGTKGTKGNKASKEREGREKKKREEKEGRG